MKTETKQIIFGIVLLIFIYILMYITAPYWAVP